MSDAHARKSRLAIPTGNVDSVGTNVASSSNTTTSSSSSSAAVSLKSPGGLMNSSSSSRPLLSSHQHHHQHGSAITAMSPMQYIQRLLDITQMDIQAGLDQMKTLISTRPQAVYKTAYYRKQTKNHWARDDPAFVALQLVFLLLACIAYSIAFRISVVSALSFIVTSVVWHWLGIGFIVATICRDIANRHLNNISSSANSNLTSNQSSSLYVRQQVEWMYAFDIHCNSFFPVFVVLYGLQFFALPVALGEGFLPLFISNTLYASAFGWYWYITHLGYRALPFLSNTEVFLFPIAAILIVYCTILIGYPLAGFGFNATRVVARLYFIP